MANVRMFPPVNGKKVTVQGGRTYDGTVAGGFVDALAADAHQLQANGWFRMTWGIVGPTTARSATPAPGDTFVDTTVPAVVL